MKGEWRVKDDRRKGERREKGGKGIKRKGKEKERVREKREKGMEGKIERRKERKKE